MVVLEQKVKPPKLGQRQVVVALDDADLHGNHIVLTHQDKGCLHGVRMIGTRRSFHLSCTIGQAVVPTNALCQLFYKAQLLLVVSGHGTAAKRSKIGVLPLQFELRLQCQVVLFYFYLLQFQQVFFCIGG